MHAFLDILSTSKNKQTKKRWHANDAWKKQRNVTILAGLSLIAPGTQARVVADADARVLARRLALGRGVKHEAERDPARRVRARRAGGQQGREGDGDQGASCTSHDRSGLGGPGTRRRRSWRRVDGKR